MSALNQLLVQNQHHPKEYVALWMAKAKAVSLSESFWFTTTMLLFIILGPFSVVVALVGVFSLASQEEGGSEPEPLLKS